MIWNKSKTLPKAFYSRSPVIVAPELLGKYLVRVIKEEMVIGKIVETEAYLGFEDEAAHSFIGKTKRNEVLFGHAGFTYVHSIHRFYCIDLVTEDIDKPTSVLIRALEPISGTNFMKVFRKTENLSNLTNGPGKLCEALNISREQNNIDVTNASSEIFVLDNTPLSDAEIVKTSRVGISKAKDLQLRFYVKGNEYVSRK